VGGNLFWPFSSPHLASRLEAMAQKDDPSEGLPRRTNNEGDKADSPDSSGAGAEDGDDEPEQKPDSSASDDEAADGRQTVLGRGRAFLEDKADFPSGIWSWRAWSLKELQKRQRRRRLARKYYRMAMRLDEEESSLASLVGLGHSVVMERIERIVAVLLEIFSSDEAAGFSEEEAANAGAHSSGRADDGDAAAAGPGDSKAAGGDQAEPKGWTSAWLLGRTRRGQRRAEWDQDDMEYEEESEDDFAEFAP
jgi:hypothetical protein